MSAEDGMMTREAMRELARRPVDTTNLDVHVMHGVVYMRGLFQKDPGVFEDIDLKNELNIIRKVLMGMRGVRDVILEVEIQGQTDEKKEKKQGYSTDRY